MMLMTAPSGKKRRPASSMRPRHAKFGASSIETLPRTSASAAGAPPAAAAAAADDDDDDDGSDVEGAGLMSCARDSSA